MAEFAGTPTGAGRRIVVVASRFNEVVTSRLADGAMDVLVRHGAANDDIDIVWVPGAWEIPAAVRRACESGRYDAAIAIGAVIRGETPHFHFVAGETARALQQAVADFDVPVGMGVLTTDTLEQAMARAGGDHGNKGADAAIAALEMADLFQRLDAAADNGLDLLLEEDEAFVTLRRSSPGAGDSA